MLQKVEDYIKKNRLFTTKSKILLGISGGVDSVVMAVLLSKKYDLSLAHCNFNLRGKESRGDEEFCRKLAEQLGLKIHFKSFETEKISKKKKVSIQMAAREARYNWFNTLLTKYKYDVLLTAHHADDQTETFFINLLRGSGVKGLKGMENKTGKIRRPFLFITKEEIRDFAKKNKIHYREDSSNKEDKYERNQLRLNVIPLLKKLNPGFDSVMTRNMAILKEENEIVEEHLRKEASAISSVKKGKLKIDRRKILKRSYLHSLLHYLLSPYTFNYSQISSIAENIQNGGITGKRFYAGSFVLVIDKHFIEVEEKKVEQKPTTISSFADLLKSNLFKTELIEEFKIPKKNELVIRRSQLIFPMRVRTRKVGDKFKPFGMNGFKLLSDFLKDEKIATLDRNEVKILENGNKDLIWIIQYRSDERYRINETNKGQLLKLTYIG